MKGDSWALKLLHMSSVYVLLRTWNPQVPLAPPLDPVLLLLQLLVSHGSGKEGAIILTSLRMHAWLIGKTLVYFLHHEHILSTS